MPLARWSPSRASGPRCCLPRAWSQRAFWLPACCRALRRVPSARLLVGSGADRSWDEAPVYRGIITAIIGISAVLVLMPGVDLFQIMMTSQVINGVLLPVVLVFQVVIAADRHIMGANRNGRVWNVLTWATIGVITVLTVVMFVLQAMGYSA